MAKYAPGLLPRDYQESGLAKMADRPAFALLMAMRTGKTLTALTDFGRMELAGKVDDLLVIAPAGVYLTWLDAIEECLSKDLRARLRIAVWESGANAKALIKLNAFMNNTSGPRCLLMNVEALSTVERARELCKAFLQQRTNMLVIDESTAIKGFKAKRSKYVVYELAPLADYRRILSGLPTPRSPLDLYMQFTFLDPKILGYNNYFAFQARYAITQLKTFGGRRPIKVVVGFRNEEELQRKIEPYSFRVPFRPDIPPTYSIRNVELTKEQRKIYNDLKNFATAELSSDAHVTATIVIAQIMRLHQVVQGHTVDEHGVEHTIPENKTKELLALLEDYNGKAIIWASYNIDILKISKALTEEYGEGSVARFWGGNANTREAEERRFKTNAACRWMVATPAAGGRGRTWDMANLVVYYNSTNNLEHRDQSENRPMNVGKSIGVDYIDLIARGTVEDKILKALRKKIDMAAVINKDTWREWVI